MLTHALVGHTSYKRLAWPPQEARKFEAQKAERWLPAVGEAVHVPRLGGEAKVDILWLPVAAYILWPTVAAACKPFFLLPSSKP